MKKWHASKTLWWNALIMIGAGAEALVNNGTLTAQQALVISSIASVVNIILRFKTDKKVTK